MAGKMWYVIKYKLQKRIFRSRIFANNKDTAEYFLRGKIIILAIKQKPLNWYSVEYKLGEHDFITRVQTEDISLIEHIIRGKIEIISIDPEIGDNGIFESLKSIFK